MHIDEALRSGPMRNLAASTVRRWIQTWCLLLALGFLAPGPVSAQAPEAAGPEAVAAAAEDDPDASSDLDDEYDDLFGEEFDQPAPGFPDPLETTNRGVFGVNAFLDKWMLDPLTRVYGFIFPGPVKQAIRNVFRNLGEPGTTVNNIVQLEWTDAGVSLSRFLINTTVGIAGIWDPAELIGLPYHRSDFGQTLALAGAPSGAYLIVPLAGPNNTRDGLGFVADFSMHPLTWFLGPTNFLLYSIYGGGQGISVREEALPKLEALREGSVDYYAAMRNAYYQNRQAEIWSRREHRRDDWADE